MDDILQSIKAYLYERATSPLIGAFVTSWVAWNYRVIIILISSDPFPVKFAAIDQYIATDTLLLWIDKAIPFYLGTGTIFPLITALLYLFGYPYIAEPVYKFTLRKQNNINKLKKQANDARIIDEKDARELFKKIADLEIQSGSDATLQLKQVEGLNTTVNEQAEKIEKLKAQITEFNLSEDLRAQDDEVMTEPQRENESKAMNSDVIPKRHGLTENDIVLNKFRLYFNPDKSTKHSKSLKFEKGGIISDGMNENENSWRLINGNLEILDSEGNIHNKFMFDENEAKLVSIEDASLGAYKKHKIKNQYIALEKGSFKTEEIKSVASTMLDLSVAYEAMGDKVGALQILEDALAIGNDKEVAEAERLMKKFEGSKS